MSQPTFFQKLWERKVPQFLGTYLAVGFGVLQFVEFISRRFTLSSFWVDRYLLLWLMLIPAVALLLYYQGLPTRAGKRLNWKKWGLFGNLALALLLVFLIPSSASPSATQTVTTTDAEGKTVNRVIPSAASVQRIAVFQLTNAEEEEDKDWWGTAYSLLLSDNLKQRPELMTFEALALNRRYAHFDLQSFARINVGMQRRIAQRARTDYFVSGEYNAGSDNHKVSGGLYRSRDGKLVQALEATGPSAFMVIDQLKDQINGFLPAPVVTDHTTTELPASALITDQEAALEAYVKGSIAFNLNPGDLPAALRHLRQAFSLDPSCATCAYMVADKLYGQGKLDSAKLLISKATRLAEALPERAQFGYKAMLMAINGSVDGYYRLMESYRNLYPYEFAPYASLENYYALTFGLDSTIVLMELAAEVSDRERALGKLYELYIRAEDYDKVEAVIKDLEKEFPDPDKTRRRYASFYQTTGQMDKARETLREMQTLDPLNADITSHIVFSELRAGNYAIAEKAARNALTQATNISDSTTAWNYLIQSYSGRGQFDRAMKELLDYEELIARQSPRNVIINRNFSTKSDYALQRGYFSLIDTLLSEVAAYDPGRAEMLACYLPTQAIIIGLRQPNDEKILDDCGPILKDFGAAAENLILLSRLMMAEDYVAAVDFLDQQLAAGKEVLPPAAEARLRRLAGNPEKAIEILNKALVARMNDPKLLLELALANHQLGNVEAAKNAIAGPLKTWSAADSDFIMARKARELAIELGLPLS